MNTPVSVVGLRAQVYEAGLVENRIWREVYPLEDPSEAAGTQDELLAAETVMRNQLAY
jgi:hypothetical protein